MELQRLIARLREQAVSPAPFPEYALRDAADALESLNKENEELHEALCHEAETTQNAIDRADDLKQRVLKHNEINRKLTEDRLASVAAVEAAVRLLIPWADQ